MRPALFETSAGILAARIASELSEKTTLEENGGRREDRVPIAPAASCAV
jgi:hypothetical protein